MKLQYIEYQEELENLYSRTKNFGIGSCLEVNGLPGAGLGGFVDSYIRKYESDLQTRHNVYCCVISCPVKDPRELFEMIVRKIAEKFCRELENRPLTEQQKKMLREIENDSKIVTEMSCRERVAYGIFSETVRQVLEKCGRFGSIINIRLFIKDFDNARKLLAKDVDYALLFKHVCEDYTVWLGVIVTSHRTLAVIALIIESFSEFASLFSMIEIIGFNEFQMQQVYEQMETRLQISLNKKARDKVWYFCGNNPRRLGLLFASLGDLKSDIASGMELVQWEHKDVRELIGQAYKKCQKQMDEHAMCIMRIAEDLNGNGLAVLKEALYAPHMDIYREAREFLFQMQILKSEDNLNKQTTVLAIPVLKEMIKNRITIKEEKGNRGMRFLHLSDLHFGFEKDETEEEIRKNYIYNFLEKIKKIHSERNIDYIFITGDIGWKAAEKDYMKAKEFLQDLLRVCGLKADRLFMCPGNHDVNQHTIEDLEYPQNQQGADRFFQLRKLEKHAEAFQEYGLLCERMGCQPYNINGYSSYLTGVCYCKDIIVICLNTAWFAKNKEQSKKVWVGKNYIITIKNMLYEHYSTIKKDEQPFLITLMHHPEKYWEEQECLDYSETTNVWKIVTRMSDMVLCGHTHEISDMENEINSARVFRGGVFYDNTTELNSFCIYDVTEEKCFKMRYVYVAAKWLQDN